MIRCLFGLVRSWKQLKRTKDSTSGRGYGVTGSTEEALQLLRVLISTCISLIYISTCWLKHLIMLNPRSKRNFVIQTTDAQVIVHIVNGSQQSSCSCKLLFQIYTSYWLTFKCSVSVLFSGHSSKTPSAGRLESSSNPLVQCFLFNDVSFLETTKTMLLPWRAFLIISTCWLQRLLFHKPNLILQMRLQQ